MTRKTKITLWIATIVIGVLMIPIGVGWIVYTVTQTGDYDPNAEFTDPNTHVTSRGAYVTDSPLPFLGFALSFRRRDLDHSRLVRAGVRMVQRPRR